MIKQRTAANPVVEAVAEALPFADAAFDVALAIFTVHHWSDRRAGLRELRRVAQRQVALVYDPAVSVTFWLSDYVPELRTSTWELEAPTPEDVALDLDVREVRRILIPADCTDGFTGAYWRRPERYLDPDVQAGMSSLARMDPDVREEGTERLRVALESGEWERAHGGLRSQETFDLGYRLVVAGA